MLAVTATDFGGHLLQTLLHIKCLLLIYCIPQVQANVGTHPYKIVSHLKKLLLIFQD